MIDNRFRSLWDQLSRKEFLSMPHFLSEIHLDGIRRLYITCGVAVRLSGEHVHRWRSMPDGANRPYSLQPHDAYKVPRSGEHGTPLFTEHFPVAEGVP